MSNGHSKSNFAESFDFHCLIKFASKKLKYVADGFFVVCVIMNTFN